MEVYPQNDSELGDAMKVWKMNEMSVWVPEDPFPTSASADNLIRDFSEVLQPHCASAPSLLTLLYLKVWRKRQKIMQHWDMVRGRLRGSQKKIFDKYTGNKKTSSAGLNWHRSAEVETTQLFARESLK